MRRSIACALVGLGVLWLAPGVVTAGKMDEPAEADTGKDPVFVQWLVPGDPGDETIREYWKRAKADQLGAEDYVDLGTMLFHRGWPKDAVRMYREALALGGSRPLPELFAAAGARFDVSAEMLTDLVADVEKVLAE